MTEWWRDLVRRATSAFSPRSYRSRSDADLVSHRRDLSLLPQMALAIEHRHVHRVAFNSVSHPDWASAEDSYALREAKPIA
jgi:hypothetical protein